MPANFESFLNRIKACNRATAWFQTRGITTFEQAWNECPEPAWMLMALGHAGYSESAGRRARKWAQQCLLLVQNYLHDPRCQKAMQVLANYAAGGSSPAEVADAYEAAQQAVVAQTQSDGQAHKSSPEFHATRALAAALSWADSDFQKSADGASLHSAKATAQENKDKIDYSVLTQQRRKQADLLRALFASDIGGFIAQAAQAT